MRFLGGAWRFPFPYDIRKDRPPVAASADADAEDTGEMAEIGDRAGGGEDASLGLARDAADRDGVDSAAAAAVVFGDFDPYGARPDGASNGAGRGCRYGPDSTGEREAGRIASLV